MKEFIRGIIMSNSRDLGTVKKWMQDSFFNVVFMDCEDGYYFEFSPDPKLFEDNVFYRYLAEELNKHFTTTLKPDFYLCLVMDDRNSYFHETHFHYFFNEWVNLINAHYIDERKLDTVQKWLKWDKLHKEYLKCLDRKSLALL